MSMVQLCVAWPNDVIWPVAFFLDGVFGQKGAGSRYLWRAGEEDEVITHFRNNYWSRQQTLPV